MTNILIGTSGYDYPEWKGIFYPEKLPRKDFLTYYSTQLNALELNNTFYSMPTKQRIESYIERSEERLHFSIKVPKLFTHEHTSSWKSSAAELKDAVNPMVEKDLLASLLFQFPDSFNYSPDNRIYLSELMKEFAGFHCVIEFRNQGWGKASVFEGLVVRNVSVAFSDMPQIIKTGERELSSFIGPEAYGRLHARRNTAWYSDSSDERYWYSESELTKFLPSIKLANTEGRRCQFYFNNDPNGTGILNAKKLKEIIKK